MGGVGPLAELLIPAIGEIGSGIGAGLTAPSPFQPRKPYTGSLDPESSLSDVQTLLKFLAPGLIDHAQQDVTLPDAVVHNVDPVGGLSLGDVGSLGKPASLPGLKFGGNSFQFPSSHGGTVPPPQSADGPGQGYTDPSGVDHPGVDRRTTTPDVPDDRDTGFEAGGTTGGNQFGSGRDNRTTFGEPTLMRQRFTPEMTHAMSADSSDGADFADPTASALALLRHAAQAA